MFDNVMVCLAANDNSSDGVSQREGHGLWPDISAKRRAFTKICSVSILSDVCLIDNGTTSCPTTEKIEQAFKGSYLADCRTLPAMELRARYPAEATAHKNMLSRSKTKGAVIDPRLKKFTDFLLHVGPMPAKGATLDRINNNDPEYAPGKVRWADKRTQNNNKSDTIIIQNSQTGEALPASQVARRQSVNSSTIRKRRDRGWLDDEIIAGKKICPQSPIKNKSAGHSNFGKLDMTMARNIMFHREAERFRFERETTGDEALPASPDCMFEVAGIVIPHSLYRRRFEQGWPHWRPHLDYDNATSYHQELIAKIDPDYVKAWKDKKAAQADLKGAL